MDLSEEEKKSLEGLKQGKLGEERPVSGGEVFQLTPPCKTTGNALWIMQLRKAFKEAYPDENFGVANVFCQGFVL